MSVHCVYILSSCYAHGLYAVTSTKNVRRRFYVLYLTCTYIICTEHVYALWFVPCKTRE